MTYFYIPFYLLLIILLFLIYKRYMCSNKKDQMIWTSTIVGTLLILGVLFYLSRWSTKTPTMFTGSTFESFSSDSADIMPPTQEQTMEGVLPEDNSDIDQQAYYMDSTPPYSPPVDTMLRTNIMDDPNRPSSQEFKKAADAKWKPTKQESKFTPDLSKLLMDVNITPKTNIEKVEISDKKKPIQITVNVINDMKGGKSRNYDYSYDADADSSYFDYIIEKPSSCSSSSDKEETNDTSLSIPSWWKSKVEGMGANGNQPMTLREIKKKYDMDVNPTEVSLYATQPSKKWNELHSYYDWLEGTFAKKYGEDKYPVATPPVWKDTVSSTAAKTCPVVLPNTQSTSYMDYDFLNRK
jgi:hypothetical protein